MDCTSHCRFKKHGSSLTSAVTSECLDDLKKYIQEICGNPVLNSDSNGRNILHIASSCGRLDFLKHLCHQYKLTSNILRTKDKESGWSVLHRAVYYGHVSSVLFIYQLLMDWRSLDLEGHTPLDLVVLDSPKFNIWNIKQVKKYIALLPFEAAEQGELTLQVGDILQVMNTNKNGWGVGKIESTGMKGLFPCSFIEEIKETEEVKEVHQINHKNDIYVWGSNINFSLGISDESNRTQPEHLEYLAMKNKVIANVVLTKFHTVMLTEEGEILTCGIGLGGRLGQGNEEVSFHAQTVPLSNTRIIKIDAGNYHTMALDEFGKVHTFGSNDFHQLGHYPAPKLCLTPKVISSKALKNKSFTGIAAARFHSVIYTYNEVYTFGLNSGQLGHAKGGEELQTAPKLVSHLFKRETKVVSVIASDGATLCLMADGDLYLLQDYVCRKIALKMVDIKKMCMTGGLLNSKLIGHNKSEPLKIVIMRNSGMIETWKNGYKAFKKVYWHGKNVLNSNIVDISLGRHLIITTEYGLCYFGYFRNNVENKLTSTESKQVSGGRVEIIEKTFTLNELVEKSKLNRLQSEEIQLEKIPLIYRSVKCFTDSKNRIFSVLQSDPRIGLTKYPIIGKSLLNSQIEELQRNTFLNNIDHDLLIKVDKTSIPAHEFIMEARLSNFKHYDITKEGDKKVIELNDYNLKDVKLWLNKLYNLNEHQGNIFPTSNKNINQSKNRNISRFTEDEIEFAKRMSNLAINNFEDPSDDFAENVYDRGGQTKKSSKQQKSSSSYVVQKDNEKSVPTNIDIAKNSRKARNQTIELGNFSRWRKLNDISDVMIESEDGQIFYCHKCILISRLDYFNSMLTNEWIESSSYKHVPLKMSIPAKILNVIIHYLYTDEATALKDIEDISFIGEVLVCADQLLIMRLKDICELTLAEKVSLKNAVEILQFACMYNAEQIKTLACEYIMLNFAYFLEARLLESLPDDVIDIFSTFYRNSIHGMKSRKIHPSTLHKRIDTEKKEFALQVDNELKEWRKRSRTISRSSESNGGKSNKKILQTHQVPLNDVFINEEKPVTNVPTKTVGIPKPKISSQQVHDEKPGVNNFPSLQAASNVTPNKTPKTSSFKKLSQKERRKLQNQKEDERTPVAIGDDTKQINAKVQQPWGSAPLSPPNVKSFIDVLHEQEAVVIPTTKQIHKKLAFHSCSAANKKKLSLSDIKEQKQDKSTPWASLPPTTAATVQLKEEVVQSKQFTNIVQYQQDETKQQIKQSKKALTIIQLEERAMGEIYNYYKQQCSSGEEIIVRRTKATAELPFWDRVLK